MIAFPCPGCGQMLKLRAELAGKKGKCPFCKRVVDVPADLAAVPAGRTSGLEDAVTLPPRPADEDVRDRVTLPPTGASPTQPVPARAAAAGVSPELYDFLAPPQGPDELGRLGPYRVLKVLGAGGMGVVYQAEDPQLQRLVALKVLLPTLAASGSARERFLREARAAGAVHHDHIIPILHINEDRGIPYLVMPFLKGETLEDRLKRVGRLGFADLLRVGRETAAGLAAAHERGLIHRDIKPANLWLESLPGGGFRVKILDFGLARGGKGDAQLTQQGVVLGTPAYMAPEQAGGRAVDSRSDLFSLGCLLYRAATGELPFKGRDTLATLMAVATEQPRPPRKVNPQVPPALSGLIMELLAKRPEDRPPSAWAVIEALDGVERDPEGPERSRTAVMPEPTRLPEVEPPRRRRRGRVAREDHTWLWVGGVIFGVVALLVVVGVVVVRMNNRPAGPGEAPPGVGGGEGPPAVDPGLRELISPAELALAGNPEGLVAVLRHPEAQGEVRSVVFSPDGRRLYSAHAAVDGPDGRGVIGVWDVATGKLLSTLRGHTQPVGALALARDGGLLASGTGDWRMPGRSAELWVWDLNTERQAEDLSRNKTAINSLAFSPGGKLLVCAGTDGAVWLYDADRWVPRVTIHGVGGRPKGLARGASGLSFSPDGQLLAIGSADALVQVYETKERGKLVKLLGGHRAWIHQTRFSPDGKVLLSTSGDGTLRTWDTSSWELLHTFRGHANQVYGAVFSPDGRWVVSAGGDATVRVWEAATGRLARTTRCGHKDLYGPALNTDGRTLAVGSQSGRVYLFRLDLGGK
jgi:eukaryotic-like serine/threonine-protein kinase